MERQSRGSRATSGARARAAADQAEAAAPAVEVVDSDGEEFADAEQAVAAPVGDLARLQQQVETLVGEVQRLRGEAVVPAAGGGEAGANQQVAAAERPAAGEAPAGGGGAAGEERLEGEAARVRAAAAAARAGVAQLGEVRPEFFADAELAAPDFGPVGGFGGFAAAGGGFGTGQDFGGVAGAGTAAPGWSAVPYDPGFERPSRLHRGVGGGGESISLYRRGEYSGSSVCPGFDSLTPAAQREVEYLHPLVGRVHDVYAALASHNQRVAGASRVPPAVFDELNAMFSFGLERLDGQRDRARAASGQGSGGMDVQASLDLMQQLRDERMDAHEFGGTYGQARQRIATMYAYQHMRARVNQQVWRGSGRGQPAGAAQASPRKANLLPAYVAPVVCADPCHETNCCHVNVARISRW